MRRTRILGNPIPIELLMNKRILADILAVGLTTLGAFWLIWFLCVIAIAPLHRNYHCHGSITFSDCPKHK